MEETKEKKMHVDLSAKEVDIIIFALGCCTDQLDSVRKVLNSETYYTIRDKLIDASDLCDGLISALATLREKVFGDAVSDQ